DDQMVEQLAAPRQLPFVASMTCLNGFFHDVYTESLAETLVRSPSGAIGVLASSTLTAAGQQWNFNEDLFRAAFAPTTPVRLGDAPRPAKAAADDTDVRRTFMLFGDPTLRVYLPPTNASSCTYDRRPDASSLLPLVACFVVALCIRRRRRPLS